MTVAKTHMANELDFSVILCTRNRAELLSHALESLRRIDFPAHRVELVLVDNGSTDATRAVVEQIAERFPFAVRYVYEPRPGLSVARNRGIKEARGDFLLFTDDDQLVDAAILREYARIVDRYAGRAIQGAIEVEFTENPPPWLRGSLANFFGKTPAEPEGPLKGDLYGGNMLLERDLFEGSKAFREDLGKGAVGYCEDTELSQRLRAMGVVIHFAPSAVQRHLIGPDRMTRSFIRKTSFQKGFSHGLLLKAGTSLLGASYSSFSVLWRYSIRAAMAGLRSDEHQRIVADARALYELGRLLGYARSFQLRAISGKP